MEDDGMTKAQTRHSSPNIKMPGSAGLRKVMQFPAEPSTARPHVGFRGALAQKPGTSL